VGSPLGHATRFRLDPDICLVKASPSIGRRAAFPSGRSSKESPEEVRVPSGGFTTSQRCLRRNVVSRECSMRRVLVKPLPERLERLASKPGAQTACGSSHQLSSTGSRKNWHRPGRGRMSATHGRVAAQRHRWCGCDEGTRISKGPRGANRRGRLKVPDRRDLPHISVRDEPLAVSVCLRAAGAPQGPRVDTA
jgi:hypothetical protein